MTENVELNPTSQITAQDLADVIEELEQYRERLLNETLTTAQRAKLSKTKALNQIEPLLAEIDAKLQALRDQQVILKVNS